MNASLVLVLCAVAIGQAQSGQGDRTGTSAPVLQPTAHPPLPAALDDFWLVPPASWQPAASPAVRRAMTALGQAFAKIKDEAWAAAGKLVPREALAGTPLEAWAAYARGRSALGLKRYDEARRSFALAVSRGGQSAVAEKAALGEAEALEGARDFAAAAGIYRDLAAGKVADLPDVLARLARAATSAGDASGATAARERLYFEFPATDEGKDAARALARVRRPALTAGSPLAARELERAQQLFARRQYTDARTGFDMLAKISTGDALELARLRVAECDYHLRRYRQAVRSLQPLRSSPSRGAEAAYYYLSAVRGTGQRAEYVKLARQLVEKYPATPWAERTMDELGSHYIIVDQDEKSVEVFEEILRRFPKSDIAQRAAWKVGWWAYRHDQYGKAASTFEQGAAAFPRSNYRPAFLYWSARARDALGQRETAVARYRLAVTDYGNLYYGRLAARRLAAFGVPVRSAPAAGRFSSASAAEPVPAGVNTELLGWLIRAGMYEQAAAEVEAVRRRAGSSRAIDTTRAWLYSQAGDRLTGISVMRQTYPHFMADGGEALPEEILKVIYPLDYWPLIIKYSAANNLDPYLMAAIVAQESAFDPAARSSANAIGLMQLVPRTARLWARRLGLRYSASRLTDPEFSVRVGTAYFAALVKQFGGEYFALAGYNAGENRVAAWKAERPGLEAEEFIDDIPFPETQAYVKRILGIADDYRRLYASR